MFFYLLTFCVIFSMYSGGFFESKSMDSIFIYHFHLKLARLKSYLSIPPSQLEKCFLVPDLDPIQYYVFCFFEKGGIYSDLKIIFKKAGINLYNKSIITCIEHSFWLSLVTRPIFRRCFTISMPLR